MARAWTRLVESVEAAGPDERVVYALLPTFSDAKVRRTVYVPASAPAGNP
ncbi:hypothetical protein [Streptomyces violaceus]|uniref:Uncharacterized protein n=1 Tax=Streptomyces violaceus TaxID=1936 RepID=A0ABZ1NSF6_STRVL